MKVNSPSGRSRGAGGRKPDQPRTRRFHEASALRQTGSRTWLASVFAVLPGSVRPKSRQHVPHHDRSSCIFSNGSPLRKASTASRARRRVVGPKDISFPTRPNQPLVDLHRPADGDAAVGKSVGNFVAGGPFGVHDPKGGGSRAKSGVQNTAFAAHLRPWSPFSEVVRLPQSGRMIEGRLWPTRAKNGLMLCSKRGLSALDQCGYFAFPRRNADCAISPVPGRLGQPAPLPAYDSPLESDVFHRAGAEARATCHLEA